MNYDQAIIKASCHFLTQELPEEWVEWSRGQLNDFLEKHAILDMAWDIADLWDCIETLAYEFIEMWNTFRLGYNITEE
jgi:hypothetical protein